MNEFTRNYLHERFQGDELYHHGIQGMHWGVKNGPPYPLDKKVSASIKAGKNKKIRVTAEEYRQARNKKHKKEDVTKRTHINIHKGDNEHWFREVNDYTGFQEMTSQGIQGTSISNVAELIGSGQGDWVRRLDRPGHKANMSDANVVNFSRNVVRKQFATHNGRLDPGLNNNCGKCSAALFLRGLGYDVEAGRSGRGVLNSAPQYWFDGAVPYKRTGARATYEQMASFGNQGKGTLNIRHANGSGHMVYFQNERGSDGRTRPIIYDGQIATRYDSLSDFLKRESVDLSRPMEITRLDTATPNWGHLAEDSVIRMGFKDTSRNLVENTRQGGRWKSDDFRFV